MGRPDTGSFGRSGSFVVFEAWNGSQGLASAPFLKRVFHRRSALAERGRPPVRAVCPQEEASVASRETSTNDTGYVVRSEEHTYELQSLMRISYAVFCLNTKTRAYKQKRQVYAPYTLQNT